MNKKPTWIWILITLATLCTFYVAIGHPSEYGFYTLVRWLVTAAAIQNAIVLSGLRKSQPLVISTCIVALLFNPIFPLYMGRDFWIVLDCIALAVLISGGIQSIRCVSEISNRDTED